MPKEYYYILYVFEKGEKETVPPHRPEVDLGSELEKGKEVPIKKVYPLNYDQIEELHRYIKENDTKRMDPEGQNRKSVPNHVCQKQRMANSDYAWTIE